VRVIVCGGKVAAFFVHCSPGMELPADPFERKQAAALAGSPGTGWLLKPIFAEDQPVSRA
jgi:hypothetical protein